MNGTGLGALEIQMLLDLLPLKKQMDEAKSLLGQGTAGMTGIVKRAMDGLVGALTVGAFTSWIKGAIDAGDEAFNLSKKIGVPVKDLGGLQLAFKQAGIDGGAMQTAMVRLAKGVTEGNDAFNRMGVSLRNADGSLKSSRAVLYDVADVFETMPDGIGKTALATEVFGKAGADLLPMLDGGSEGLRDMAEMADRLGLTMSDETAAAADEFNDTMELLGLSTKGLAQQAVAQLLPTLKSVAGSFLDNVTSGGRLAGASEVLAFALKGLFSVGVVGVEVFSTLGKVLASVAGAAIAAVQGEFTQAWKILEEGGRDITAGWSTSAKTISDVWTGAGSATVDQSNKINKALRDSAIATKEQADAAKKAAEEQAKLTKAGADYLAGLDANLAAAQQQLATGRALSDADKELLKLEEQLRQGKLLLTDAQQASARATIVETEAVRASAELKRELGKIEFEAMQAALKATEAVAAETAKQLEHNATLGMTQDQLRALGVARVADSLATAEQALQAAILRGVQGSELEQYTLMVEELRLLKKAKEEGAAKEAGLEAAAAAKLAAEEWKKTTESINAGLTDALMRAFESGKGFWDAFKDTLTNAAKTLILKPIIEYLVRPVGMAVGAIGNAGGAFLAGATGQQQPAGSLLGNVSGMGSLYGLGSSAYSAATPYANAAYSYLTTGSTVGTTATNAALIESASGTAGYGASSASAAGSAGSGFWGSTAGTATGAAGGLVIGNQISDGQGILGNGSSFAVGIGTAIGSIWGPWGAAIGGALGGLVNKWFGQGNDEVVRSGVAGTFQGGTLQNGHNFANIHQGTGGYRWDATALGKVEADALAAGAAAIYAQATEYGKALGLPVRQLAAVRSEMVVDLGADAQANANAISKAVNAYGDALVATYADQLKAVKLAGETTLQTMERLGSALTVTNTAFGNLGLQLLDASVAGGKAAATIVGLTGGLDAFVQKTTAYMQSYFSEGEQTAMLAQGIRQQLAAAGLSGMLDTADSRDDLRALLEAANPNTQAGQQQIAGLLNVAQDFAKVADYLAANGLRLADLAATAPGSVLAAQLEERATRPEEPDRAYALAVASNEQLGSIASSSAATVTQLQALVAATVETGTQVLRFMNSKAAALGEADRQARLADLAQP